MTATYETVLLEAARADPRLIVVTAENRAAIRGLPAALGPRFIDTGITEQTMIGMAAGLALRGRIPVVHALATFLTMRAFEFIRTDVGIPGLPVKLVGAVPGVLSEANGPTHQALEDVALMRGIPSVRVFCPADLEDLLAGLPAVLADPHPWYIRYCDRPAVTSHGPFELGRAEVFHAGGRDDVALLVSGALFREAWEAAARLRQQGCAVRVLNVRTVKPLDAPAVIDAARHAAMLVTVEDHFEIGGLYSAVAELLVRGGVSARVLPISCGDRWFTPSLLPDVLVDAGFTPDAICDRVLSALHQRTPVPAHA
ncbi:MAG TPA: transketolase C-terminal domain-containing protein [Gemmatimonadales bacterium]|nr:transketolase C-terminal domain-containing protein [Gemmatimonadales bacterium]